MDGVMQKGFHRNAISRINNENNVKTCIFRDKFCGIYFLKQGWLVTLHLQSN